MSKRIAKKELWAKVRVRLEELAAELRKKSLAELEELNRSPVGEKMLIGNVSIQISSWAEPHGEDYLAVFVDGWRTRFLGWHQSAAVGFLMDRHGNVEEMKGKEFWEHGY